ncbi:uncharacterized protein [Diadema antillarum]|uniref:uncharacterized protein n=1 Tax=Diadema antillarum TaxID=105358 RepID=UPI003A848D38
MVMGTKNIMDNSLDRDISSPDAVPAIAGSTSAMTVGLPGSRPSKFPIKIPESQGKAQANAATRPGRYDEGVETRPLTPPGSSQNLQLVFDSSKIYHSHPRKYRLLLDTDQDSTSANDASTATTSKAGSGAKQSPALMQVKDGQVITMGTTSNIPKPPADDTGPTGSSAPFTMPDAMSGRPGSQVGPAEIRSGESRYIPQSFMDSVKGPVVGAGSADHAVGHPADKLASPQGTGGHVGTKLNNPSSADGKSVKNSQSQKGVKPDCTVVHPEPRRLFGFGPYYRPLPETVCYPVEPATGVQKSNPAGAGSAPWGLSRAIERAGLSGTRFESRGGASMEMGAGPGMSGQMVSVDSTDGGGGGGRRGSDGAKLKPSPSPAEVNAWLTGPF